MIMGRKTELMSDVLIMALMVAALLVLDVLALQFGADSRRFTDPHAV
jgi:hypothetical protein